MNKIIIFLIIVTGLFGCNNEKPIVDDNCDNTPTVEITDFNKPIVCD